MSIYHCSIKIIGRSNGRSSVASSAYRAGENLLNKRDGVTHNYSNKDGVEYTEIILPQNAPDNFIDRSTLWNEVEKSEIRKDARTAREIEVALPIELNREQQIELIREYVKDNFVAKGMIADIAIHDTNNGNPHAHVMLTTREVNANSFGKKNRDWDKKEHALVWRENWANVTNKHLERAGLDKSTFIDHRSNAERGIEQIPSIHLGHVANALEKKGVATYKGNINREINNLNSEYNNKLESINSEIIKLENEKDKVRDSLNNNKFNSIDEIANLIYESKKDYIGIGNEIEKCNDAIIQIDEKIEINNLMLKSINNDYEVIKNIDDDLIKLKNELEDIKGISSLFKRSDKKDLNNKIELLEKDKSNMLVNFNKKYNCMPNNEIKIKITKIKQEINTLMDKKDYIKDKNNSLTLKEKEIEINCKCLSLACNNMAEKLDIQNKLNELEEKGLSNANNKISIKEQELLKFKYLNAKNEIDKIIKQKSDVKMLVESVDKYNKLKNKSNLTTSEKATLNASVKVIEKYKIDSNKYDLMLKKLDDFNNKISMLKIDIKTIDKQLNKNHYIENRLGNLKNISDTDIQNISNYLNSGKGNNKIKLILNDLIKNNADIKPSQKLNHVNTSNSSFSLGKDLSLIERNIRVAESKSKNQNINKPKTKVNYKDFSR